MSIAKYSIETVTWVQQWTATLLSFRTSRSAEFNFVAGQFARLGLAVADANAPDGTGQRLVWRAYSIVSGADDAFLEFYSVLVPTGEFTTALATMKPGDSLFVERIAYGFLTTERFAPAAHLWMLSTGTGLGPFLSIARDPKVLSQFEHLIIVNSVRDASELVYRDVLSAPAPKITYIPVVTRGVPGDFLRQRIPTLIATGELEARAAAPMTPDTSCVMLCGNPAMVDETRKLLAPKGFTTSRRGQPGTLAVENYW